MQQIGVDKKLSVQNLYRARSLDRIADRTSVYRPLDAPFPYEIVKCAPKTVFCSFLKKDCFLWKTC